MPIALQQIVAALSPHPAFIVGRRWDVLSYNRPAELLFRFDEPCPPYSRNVVWRFFERGGIRNFDLQWERQAQNLVANSGQIMHVIMGTNRFGRLSKLCNSASLNSGCGGRSKKYVVCQMAHVLCNTLPLAC